MKNYPHDFFEQTVIDLAEEKLTVNQQIDLAKAMAMMAQAVATDRVADQIREIDRTLTHKTFGDVDHIATAIGQLGYDLGSDSGLLDAASALGRLADVFGEGLMDLVRVIAAQNGRDDVK